MLLFYVMQGVSVYSTIFMFFNPCIAFYATLSHRYLQLIILMSVTWLWLRCIQISKKVTWKVKKVHFKHIDKLKYFCQNMIPIQKNNCQVVLRGIIKLTWQIQQKNMFPSISFFQPVLPAKGFSLRILLFDYMELDCPQNMVASI